MNKTFEDLVPIAPRYQYNREENLATEDVTHDNGLKITKFKGFDGFKDIDFVKGSCMVLTDAISLSAIFSSDSESYDLFQGGLVFKLRQTKNNIWVGRTNRKIGASANGDSIYMSPRSEGAVQLSIAGLYFQIEETYPYTCSLVTAEELPDNPDLYHFYPQYYPGIQRISFSVKTNEGFRFLALNSTDKTMRATGVVFDTIEEDVQDYKFECVAAYLTDLTYGFNPQNSWGVYYNEFDKKENNTNAQVPQDTYSKKLDVPTHMMVDFPLSQTSLSSVGINIANLKTNLTPNSTPSPRIL